MKTEEKLKHLEFIQAVINRMAGNSFLLKGWSITLVAASFALAAKDTNVIYVFVAYFPLLIFWLLDGYFLRQERLYRALYDEVRLVRNDKIDFSMDTGRYKKEGRNSWLRSIFSGTLIFFYLPLAVIMLWVAYLLN